MIVHNRLDRLLMQNPQIRKFKHFFADNSQKQAVLSVDKFWSSRISSVTQTIVIQTINTEDEGHAGGFEETTGGKQKQT